MVNIQWKENGKIRYENLLSENSVNDFVTGLKDRGCTDMEITKDIEKVVAERIRRYNSGQKMRGDIMEKKFKSGDIIYDKNLEEYGKFIDYTNDTECKIEVIINNVIERHCVDYKNLCFATVENVCQHLENKRICQYAI